MPKFVPRQRKHKVRQRLQQDQDSKASGVFDPSTALKGANIQIEDEGRKRELRERLIDRQNIHSSKKKKRLEKYIVGHNASRRRSRSLS